MSASCLNCLRLMNGLLLNWIWFCFSPFFLFLWSAALRREIGGFGPAENMPDEKNELPSELPFNLDPKKLAKVSCGHLFSICWCPKQHAERIRVLAQDTVQGE